MKRSAKSRPPICTLLTLLLVVLIGSIETAPTTAKGDNNNNNKPNGNTQQPFNANCAESSHTTAHVECRVTEVSCSAGAPLHFAAHATDEAHDVRVAALARTKTTTGSGAPPVHQLHVDLSWQTPLLAASNNDSNNSSTSADRRLSFYLVARPSVEDDTEVAIDAPVACFLFSVDVHDLQEPVAPRLHFESTDLFKFGAHYSFELHSLPRSRKTAAVVHVNAAMPESPEQREQQYPADMAEMCGKHVEPTASKWTAGFRRIFLHTLARTIQVEFVGAPPQYCFHAYEVRLLDESALDLLATAIVPASAMRRESADGGKRTLLFGTHNFTGLAWDTKYIPSVIPLERAPDGRCLCPVLSEGGGSSSSSDANGGAQFDHIEPDEHAVCSCIAANWKPVVLPRPEKTLPKDEPSSPPSVDMDIRHEHIHRRSNWPLWIFLLAALLVVLCLCLAAVVLHLFRRWFRRTAATEKTSRIQLLAANGGPINGQGALEDRPLVLVSPRLLLVYAHDHPLHADCVAALASALRSAGCDVHFDAVDDTELEANWVDYANTAVLKADRVLLVNSRGAAERASAPGSGKELVCRHPSPLEPLFETEMHLALQHPAVLSVRFSYTARSLALPALRGFLQYSVPDNIAPLMATIFSGGSRLANGAKIPQPSSTAMEDLQRAVGAAAAFFEAHPQWFDEMHEWRDAIPQAVGQQSGVLQTPRKQLNVPVAVQTRESAEEIIAEPTKTPSEMVVISGGLNSAAASSSSSDDSALYTGDTASIEDVALQPKIEENAEEDAVAEEEEEEGEEDERAVLMPEARRIKLAPEKMAPEDNGGDSGVIMTTTLSTEA